VDDAPSAGAGVQAADQGSAPGQKSVYNARSPPIESRVILQPGEKIHVIHRRFFEKEPHRHFIGVVEACADGAARVVGHVWTVDRVKYVFVKRPEKRTRVISLVSGDLLINVLPPSVDLDRIVYKQEKKSVRVTDGSDWHLDLSELAWM
jgi:hypothetical protein